MVLFPSYSKMMRTPTCRFFLGFLFAVISFTEASAFTREPLLQQLLDDGDYFRFREEYATYTDTSFADVASIAYYGAWESYLFNKPETSNKYIYYFDLAADNADDSARAELLQLHLQNDLRLFEYRAADSICTLLLFRYPSVIDKPALDDIRNFASIASGLKDVPKQEMTRNGDLDVPYKRDLAGLLRIPVLMNGKEDDFIFDSGANLSTVSYSEAKRMNVRVLEAGFNVATSSRAGVEAKLGIADELKIGTATFRNVVFIVLPDESLKFLGGIYKIKGIIGFPVIAQLGEVQIRKDGRIFSPVMQTESNLRNMGLDGNTPFTEVEFYGEKHAYVFDTGAAASILNAKFREAHTDSLENAESGTTRVGGAGGVEKISVLTVKQLRYKTGGQRGTLKSVQVQLSGSSRAHEKFYGIVGQDIFRQWETVTINFDKMFFLLS